MRKKLTETVSIHELEQMYDSKMSIADIAKSCDTTYQTVWRYLKDYIKDHPNNQRGGRCAARIPSPRRALNDEACEMQRFAEKNSANACLVVENKLINLEGVVGKYMVDAKSKTIVCQIGGATFDLQPDAIPGLVEELKALGRNVGQIAAGCEMW